MGVRCGVEGVSEPLDVACFFCEALDSVEACFLGRVGAMAFDCVVFAPLLESTCEGGRLGIAMRMRECECVHEVVHQVRQ